MTQLLDTERLLALGYLILPSSWLALQIALKRERILAKSTSRRRASCGGQSTGVCGVMRLHWEMTNYKVLTVICRGMKVWLTVLSYPNIMSAITWLFSERESFLRILKIGFIPMFFTALGALEDLSSSSVSHMGHLLTWAELLRGWDIKAGAQLSEVVPTCLRQSGSFCEKLRPSYY